MIIRPLIADDLPVLKAMLDAKDGVRLEQCLPAAEDGDAFVLVAVEKGEALGLAVVHVHPHDDMGWHPEGGTLALLEAGDAYLANIEVQKGRRGWGIGSALIEAAELQAAGCGRKRIWCHTGEANRGAQRFYERHGWQHKATLQVPWQPAGQLSRVYCKELDVIGADRAYSPR